VNEILVPVLSTLAGLAVTVLTRLVNRFLPPGPGEVAVPAAAHQPSPPPEEETP
jgi:hypothetical protein